MKRKKGGKRCVESSRVAGKADAMDRISAWQAEASGEVAERLGALGEAVWESDALGRGLGIIKVPMYAAPQHLRQDW